MLLSGVKYVIFDWDGTLFDSMAIKKQNFVKNFISQKVGDEFSLYDLHEKYSGLPRKILFSKVFEELTNEKLNDDKFKLMSDEYTSMNMAGLKSAKVFEDVEVFLEHLRRKRICFSISSSAHPVEVNDGARRFPDITAEFILGSEGGFCKGPAHTNFIIKDKGIQLHEVLFIGDDDNDKILAANSGTNFFQVKRPQVNLKSLIDETNQ